MDTLGGAAVRSSAMSSGNAAGEGRTGAAIGWGAASGRLVAVNAFSFGRMGQMLGGTAGRAGVMEFGAQFQHEWVDLVHGTMAQWSRR